MLSRYIGIDYSGAKSPIDSLKGLRVYSSSPGKVPLEVPRPAGPKWYWTRRGVAEWLVKELKESAPTLVGIDHGFSFPKAYFQKYEIPANWEKFMDDFCAHWPTDQDNVCVDFVRDGLLGRGKARQGSPRWRRVTELRAKTAKAVFHFDVPGSVAKSTHSGIPWLRNIRQKLGSSIHFWPFDGWTPKPGSHVIVEVYPALWKERYPVKGLTQDQQDAYTICSWFQETDKSADLYRYFDPNLTPEERTIAEYEGWILGVK